MSVRPSAEFEKASVSASVGNKKAGAKNPGPRPTLGTPAEPFGRLLFRVNQVGGISRSYETQYAHPWPYRHDSLLGCRFVSPA